MPPPTRASLKGSATKPKLPNDTRGAGGDTKSYDVIYKGEPGQLKLTPKVFHYEADIIDATIKCSWNRVEKRQLSPPGSPIPLLKLVLVSGRTAVFELPSLSDLLELVKDVKERMDAAEQNKANKALAAAGDANSNNPRASTTSAANTSNPRISRAGIRYSTNTGYMSMSQLPVENTKAVGNKDKDHKSLSQLHKDKDKEQPRRKEDTGTEDTSGDTPTDMDVEQPPSKITTTKQPAKKAAVTPAKKAAVTPAKKTIDDFAPLDNKQTKPDDEKKEGKPDDDDDRPEESAASAAFKRGFCAVCPCDSIWFWLCLGLTCAILALIVTLIVLFGLNSDSNSGGGGSSFTSTKPLCSETAEDISSCPPDDGLEYLYSIHSVEYVWEPSYVRLEYSISDYIKDDSLKFMVLDGVNCRGSDDQLVPQDNPWMKMDLVDGAPDDGGVNLYNEGRGKRQFDIVLEPRNVVDSAPFFYPSSPAPGETKAFLTFCVSFEVYYNKVEGYDGTREVNYIENALQVNVDLADPDMVVITDVQIRTVTRPDYR